MTTPRKSRFAAILDARHDAPVAATEASSAQQVDVVVSQAVLDLPITSIRPNAAQPRKHFSDEELDQLAATIRERGLLQPVVVRSIPPVIYDGAVCSYELILGERRWRASKRAGLATIRALVNDVAPEDVLELALIENVQRADLNPVEEGAAFVQLMELKQLIYQDVADRVQQSIGYVQNRVRVAQADQEMQQLVLDRPDALSHVYYLQKITDPVQRTTLIAAVREERLSLAETRQRAQDSVLAQEVERRRSEGGGASEPETYLRKYDPALPPSSPALTKSLRQVERLFGRFRRDARVMPSEDRVALLAYLNQLTLTMEALIDDLNQGEPKHDES